MKKATGKLEAEQGAIITSHADKVKFKVKYDDKLWPKERDGKPGPKRHLREGDVLVLHEMHANTLVKNGQGEIIEYLNEKRDKSLDKKKA